MVLPELSTERMKMCTPEQMKLSAYIVRVDSGFSPNPFGRRCTLACCKPSLRRKAEVADIVVGTTSIRFAPAGRLIYAMRVGEILSFDDYWMRYPSKRPTQKSPLRQRGDNIWHTDSKGSWVGVLGALHDDRHRERDLRGERVLISGAFYYFGSSAIAVPEEFQSLLATTQGHKNTTDTALIKQFWKWLERTAPRQGRIGKPTEFTPSGCDAQRSTADSQDDE